MKPALPLATCPCRFVVPTGVSPSSPEYHRAHRDAHLAAFPECGQLTRENLDFFVRLAESGRFVEPAPTVVVS